VIKIEVTEPTTQCVTEVFKPSRRVLGVSQKFWSIMDRSFVKDSMYEELRHSKTGVGSISKFIYWL